MVITTDDDVNKQTNAYVLGCVSSVHAGDATTFGAFGAVAALRHDEEGAGDGPFVDTDAR